MSLDVHARRGLTHAKGRYEAFLLHAEGGSSGQARGCQDRQADGRTQAHKEGQVTMAGAKKAKLSMTQAKRKYEASAEDKRADAKGARKLMDKANKER